MQRKIVKIADIPNMKLYSTQRLAFFHVFGEKIYVGCIDGESILHDITEFMYITNDGLVKPKKEHAGIDLEYIVENCQHIKLRAVLYLHKKS